MEFDIPDAFLREFSPVTYFQSRPELDGGKGAAARTHRSVPIGPMRFTSRPMIRHCLRIATVVVTLGGPHGIRYASSEREEDTHGQEIRQAQV